jgi:hypothetical protein
MVWASLLLAGEEDWHCARNRRKVPFPELSNPIYTRFKSGVPLLSSLQDHYRFLVSPFTYIPSNSKGQPFIVNTLGSFLLLMRSLMLRFHYQTTKNRRGGGESLKIGEHKIQFHCFLMLLQNKWDEGMFLNRCFLRLQSY